MHSNHRDVEIVPADKAFRTRVVVAIVALGGVGAVLIGKLKTVLEKIQMGSDVDQSIVQLKQLVMWMAAGNALLSMIFVAVFIRIGIRILTEERFPPVGMKMLKETHVRLGAKARFTGIGFFVLSLIILSTNAIWIKMFFVIESLATST